VDVTKWFKKNQRATYLQPDKETEMNLQVIVKPAKLVNTHRVIIN
jgi:hypothetical protein